MATLTYEEARDYLTSMLVFGIRIGLERIVELLAELGHPEKDLRVFHIAGTNGKGSISSYLAHILAAAGYRTGWFTSPYLIRFTERIRVLDGVSGMEAYHLDDAAGEIGEDEFAHCMTTIRDAVNRMMARGLEPPTEFELIAAAAFLHFKAVGCDFVVLETGLGGRLDATNVIDRPLATIIGTIGHDHQERLGDTIAKVASEKAGIIKEGVPLYAYEPDDSLLSASDAAAVRDVLSEMASQRSAPLRFIGTADLSDVVIGLDAQSFTFDGRRCETGMLAYYQAIHAALAIAAAAPHVPAEALAAGVRAARWPGRLEQVRQNPYVLLDGAHNEEGVKALRRALDSFLPAEPVTVLLGMLKDKDTDAMTAAFFAPPVRPLHHVYCTAPASERALDPALLAGKVANAAFAGYNTCVTVSPDPMQAVVDALSEAHASGTRLIVFGSLYLVGAVRNTLRTWQPDQGQRLQDQSAAADLNE